jgi:dienelactone hydrolase
MFPSGDASLHYRLDLPTGPGPHPAVVIGHGSGITTLAEGAAFVPMFNSAGFAVLRYDKRGVGQSTGTYRGLSAANSVTQVDELAGDMVAGVTFLRSLREINAARIGLFGVSQAGWIMIAAARKSADVRFFIATVGSTMPVGVNIFYERLPTTNSLDANYAALAAFAGERGWDPQPAMAELNIPALWLLGADDRLVPTRECVKTIAAMRNSGARFTAQVYANVGHELSGFIGRFESDLFAWMRSEGLR